MGFLVEKQQNVLNVSLKHVAQTLTFGNLFNISLEDSFNLGQQHVSLVTW